MQGPSSPRTSSYFSTLPFGNSGSWTSVCPSLELSASQLSSRFVWDPPFPGSLWSVPRQSGVPLPLLPLQTREFPRRAPSTPSLICPPPAPLHPVWPGLRASLLKRTRSCLSHRLV